MLDVMQGTVLLFRFLFMLFLLFLLFWCRGAGASEAVIVARVVMVEKTHRCRVKVRDTNKATLV